MLAEGWASPLSGFMRERQYLQCLHYGQILDLKREFEHIAEKEVQATTHDDEFPFFEPINQSIPIVLAINDEQRAEILRDVNSSSSVNLTYNGKLIAVLNEPEIYPHRKEERIRRQFGFDDDRHPSIRMIRESGNWLIGGDLQVIFLFFVVVLRTVFCTGFRSNHVQRRPRRVSKDAPGTPQTVYGRELRRGVCVPASQPDSQRTRVVDARNAPKIVGEAQKPDVVASSARWMDER